MQVARDPVAFPVDFQARQLLLVDPEVVERLEGPGEGVEPDRDRRRHHWFDDVGQPGNAQDDGDSDDHQQHCHRDQESEMTGQHQPRGRGDAEHQPCLRQQGHSNTGHYPDHPHKGDGERGVCPHASCLHDHVGQGGDDDQQGAQRLRQGRCIWLVPDKTDLQHGDHQDDHHGCHQNTARLVDHPTPTSVRLDYGPRAHPLDYKAYMKAASLKLKGQYPVVL